MYRFSNTTLGYLNLLTLLASIPLIGAGLWMTHSSSSLCTTSLQTPVVVIGFIILLVSLAGFIGACFHIAVALWLYLFFMFFLILALFGLAIFGLAVTTGGGGHEISGREYREYRLSDYSGWLRDKIEEREYWKMALGCIVGSNACDDMQYWSQLDFLQRDLTPVQVQMTDYRLLKNDNSLCQMLLYRILGDEILCRAVRYSADDSVRQISIRQMGSRPYKK